jgi:acetyl esterase/lipase
MKLPAAISSDMRDFGLTMPLRLTAAVALLCLLSPCGLADQRAPLDAAAAFGARPSISDLTLSPDGMSIAWIAPTKGPGSVVYTLALTGDAKPRVAALASGKPERLHSCRWVSNERLVCTVVLARRDPAIGVVTLSRVLAVNVDGSNLKLLSKRDSEYTRGWQLYGGEVIDWLPDADGAVLMTRVYLPNEHLGSLVGSKKEGLGVDEVDTRTLQARQVERPGETAQGYISDGRGHVRIAGFATRHGSGQATGVIDFKYHPQGSEDWRPLSTYQFRDHSGFVPEAIDAEHNVAYGFRKLNGRAALYSIALDDSLREELVYANPDVDVAGLVRIGRRNRVVGATYVTEYGHAVFFAPEIKSLVDSLVRALPEHPSVKIVDSNVDESRLLVLSGSDTDPGQYRLFDRKTHQLGDLLPVRSELAGVQLAREKPVSYTAADGTPIPGYLTLPPGKESVQGLPAIVMPHGGPSARDVWGFDWLAQFFAARGYAVLQPNFRGSAGYGEAWFQQNGFRSWNVAIGDVLDGGRWLVKEGIADPRQLAIVGWSYGGYAALQSAVVDPTLFKAVVAIAPVTDLNELKEEHRHWTDWELVSEFIGDGPHTHEGSPAENAGRIHVPVLLFHGELDRNVGVQQSRTMEARLKSAGGSCELVTWPDLDHHLDDSDARTLMLRRSDAFLRKSFGQ